MTECKYDLFYLCFILSICFILSVSYFIFWFQKKIKNFCEYIKMENPSYKNKKFARKFLIDMGKNQSLKVKNSLLELEKDFTE